MPTDEGWLYVATVQDMFSRRVVGWAMSETWKQTWWSKPGSRRSGRGALVEVRGRRFITATVAASMPVLSFSNNWSKQARTAA